MASDERPGWPSQASSAAWRLGCSAGSKCSATIGRMVGSVAKCARSLAANTGSSSGAAATVRSRKPLKAAPNSPAEIVGPALVDVDGAGCSSMAPPFCGCAPVARGGTMLAQLEGSSKGKSGAVIYSLDLNPW
jgi:hypothetical protein